MSDTDNAVKGGITRRGFLKVLVGAGAVAGGVVGLNAARDYVRGATARDEFWKKYPRVDVNLKDGSVKSYFYEKGFDSKPVALYDEDGTKHWMGGLEIAYPFKVPDGDQYRFGVFKNGFAVSDKFSAEDREKILGAYKLIEEKSPADAEYVGFWVERIEPSDDKYTRSGSNGLVEIGYRDMQRTVDIVESFTHKSKHIDDYNTIDLEQPLTQEEYERRALRYQVDVSVRVGLRTQEEANKYFEDGMKTRWWEKSDF